MCLGLFLIPIIQVIASFMVRCANMDLDNFEKYLLFTLLEPQYRMWCSRFVINGSPTLLLFTLFVYELMQSHDLSSKDNDLFSGLHPCQMESHGGRWKSWWKSFSHDVKRPSLASKNSLAWKTVKQTSWKTFQPNMKQPLCIVTSDLIPFLENEPYFGWIKQLHYSKGLQSLRVQS